MLKVNALYQITHVIDMLDIDDKSWHICEVKDIIVCVESIAHGASHFKQIVMHPKFGLLTMYVERGGSDWIQFYFREVGNNAQE